MGATSKNVDRDLTARRILLGAILGLVAILTLSIGFLTPNYFARIGDKFAGLLSDDSRDLPPIRVAIAGDFNGPEREIRLPTLRGAQMLVDELNASGGVAGHPIELVVFDDKGDPKSAERIAEQIGNDPDIVAVIGHANSETSRPAAHLYRLYKVPALTSTATNPNVTLLNDWYFRLIYNDSLQAKVLAHYLRSVMEHESVAIVMEQSAYAQTLSRTFANTAADIALNVGAEFSFSPESPDSVIQEIGRRISLMNELDAVLLVMTMSQAERFLPILRRYGTQADLIGTDSLSHIQFSSEHRAEPVSAPEYLEELLLPVPFIPDTASRGARDFMAEYEAKYGDSPTWAALFGYDTVLVLAAALERISPLLESGDTASIRGAIRDQLANMGTPDTGVSGLTGPTYFNTDGDVIRAIYLGRVDDGRLSAASQQLLIVENPDTVAVLREEGENVIEVDDAVLQLTQVVKTGVQFHEIADIDIEKKTFRATFNIWFRYSGGFTPGKVIFINAAEPLILDEPVVDRTLGNQRYQSYLVDGVFNYEIDIEQLRRSVQDFRVRYRHSQRDLNRLVFIPDLRAMGADSARVSWADGLRAREVLDSDSGWVIQNATISQEIDNVSTMGDPLMPLVEIPYSAFQATVNAGQAEVSLKRQIEQLLPRANSWTVVALLILFLFFIGHASFRRHFPILTTLLRLVIVTLIVFYLEDALFNTLDEYLEPFELEILLTIFKIAWWVIPALWVIALMPYLLWSPIERKTGYAVSSIARLAATIAVWIVTIACIVAFVFHRPLSSLWAASGVLTIVLGFALRSLIMDVFSGLMLSIERPFKIGDWIKVSGRAVTTYVGRVDEMNWRTTRLWTDDNNTVVIPNSVIAVVSVENLSEPTRIKRVYIPIVLHSRVPVHTALETLLAGAMKAVGADGLLSKPLPTVVVETMESLGVRYRVQGFHDQARVSGDIAITALVNAVTAHLAEKGLTPAIQEISINNGRSEPPAASPDADQDARVGRPFELGVS
jgi:branched-chain amino acid transport system substrate-binding protein